MKKRFASLAETARLFASGIGERKLTIYATSGCYYLFMSLVPIVMIFCCILPYTPFNQEMLLSYIDEYFAESLGSIIRNIVNAIFNSNAATLTISIILALFSASASLKAIIKGVNAAYDTKVKSNYIKFTLVAMAYMIFFVITLLIALVIMVFGKKILLLLKSFLPSVGVFGFLLSGGRYLLVMLFLFAVFLVFFKLMPQKKLSFKDQIPGAVFSAIIWVVFSWIFALYVNISDKYGAYGVIGTVMVTMLWSYYCLLFMLIGGYLNSFLSEKRSAAALAADTETFEIPSANECEISEENIENETDDKKNGSHLSIIVVIGGILAAIFAIAVLLIRKKKHKPAETVPAKLTLKDKILSKIKIRK